MIKSLKIIFINTLIFVFSIFLIECIFGTWFKNEFKFKLSSERNIYRVYKFDFTKHSGTSLYIRDKNGFRIKNKKDIDPKNIDIIFIGGSTTNQKFLNYEYSIVGRISYHYDNISFANAGVDGLSIIGHMSSFEHWFNKIENFNPKIFIFYLGVNDFHLINTHDENPLTAADTLTESSRKARIREYVESNSFFYKNIRMLKSVLYLKYGFEKGVNHINKKTVVYHEPSKLVYVPWTEWYQKKPHSKRLFMNNFDDDYIKNKDNGLYGFDLKKFKKTYSDYLVYLTNAVQNKNSKIVFITQTNGTGIGFNSYVISQLIMNHCDKYNLKCIHQAKELDLKVENFFDSVHLNYGGSLKASNYLIDKLKPIIDNTDFSKN